MACAVLMALRHNDILALYLDDDDKLSGQRQGFLGSDPIGHQGASTEEVLVIMPMRQTATGVDYPPSFQARSLFRIDVGRGYSSSAGDDLVYGQAIMLMHVNTRNVPWQPARQEDVRLQPSRQSGAYFVIEPRYKLRSEGEKVNALDHIVLQSRRFAGAYLHASSLGIDEARCRRAFPAQPRPTERLSASAIDGEPSSAANMNAASTDTVPSRPSRSESFLAGMKVRFGSEPARSPRRQAAPPPSEMQI